MENLKTISECETPDDLEELKAIMHKIVKIELQESWEPELKAERMAAERKRGRELAKQADQNFTRGRVSALCDVAVYFIRKDRLDIAQHVLEHFMIDHEKATASLITDKRAKNLTLSYLERALVWGKLGVPEAI